MAQPTVPTLAGTSLTAALVQQPQEHGQEKKFNEDALDALFKQNSNGHMEMEKAEVASDDSPFGRRTSSGSAAVRQIDFHRTGSTSSDTDLAFQTTIPTPGRTWGLGNRTANPRKTIADLISEDSIDEKVETSRQSEVEHEKNQDSYTSPGHIALLTEIDTSSAQEEPSEDEAAAESWLVSSSSPARDSSAYTPKDKGVGKENASPKPDTTSAWHSRTEIVSEIEPESEILPDDEPGHEIVSEQSRHAVSGGSHRPARDGVKDTLGRLNPVTSIDRLATPAIRKAQPPAHAVKLDLPQSNGSAWEESASIKPVLKSWRTMEDYQEPSPRNQAGKDSDLEHQSSLRSARSSDSGSLGIAIPSGNTKKMAHLFGRGS